jgi:hypothetical protein
MFDAVAIIAGPAGDQALGANPDAVSFLMDACRHLKAIALAGVPELAKKAQVAGRWASRNSAARRKLPPSSISYAMGFLPAVGFAQVEKPLPALGRIIAICN